jgi:hypothetical protein
MRSIFTLATDILRKHGTKKKLVTICGLKYKYLLNITPWETDVFKGVWFRGPGNGEDGGIY